MIGVLNDHTCASRLGKRVFLPGQFQFTVFQPEDRASVMLALLGKSLHIICSTILEIQILNALHQFIGTCQIFSSAVAHKSQHIDLKLFQHFFVFLPFFLILNSGTEIFNAKGRKSQAVMGGKCWKYIRRCHGVASRLRNQKRASLSGVFFAHTVKI